MHHKEWIKKYSPTNEIYTIKDLADLLGMASNNLAYYLNHGYLMKDSETPELFKPEEVK